MAASDFSGRVGTAVVKVSIAMATYNGAAYLTEQLESFVAQTRRPDELVVSDDGSTDATIEILERFAGEAPFPVRLYRNTQRLGYAGNFDRALQLASGDLVFLSDQDDVWFPEKLARVAAAADADPSGMVFMNDAGLTFADLRDSGFTKLGQLASARLPESNFVMGCCAAVRREFLDLCLPLPGGCPSHDAWIVGLALGLGRRRVIREVLQWYRRHGDNASQAATSRTRPVSWIDVRIDAWRSVRRRRRWRTHSPSPASGRADGWDWMAARRAWLRRTESTIPAALRRELQCFAAALDDTEARHAIRASHWYQRPSRVLARWRTGEYARASGILSALRDIVGL